MELETNLEKKSIYLAAFGMQDDAYVFAKTEIDSLKEGSNFANFLNDLFGIGAVVSVGTSYEKSEIVYANDSYLKKEEEVGQTKTA